MKTNVANWVNSGLYLTSPQAYVDFFYRGFCQMAHHFGRQVGHEANMVVDYAKLAECFTLVEKNGTKHTPKFWELHPGSTARSEELGCTRAESIELWQKHKTLHAKFIPYAVHTDLQRQRGTLAHPEPRDVAHHSVPAAAENSKNAATGANPSKKRKRSNDGDTARGGEYFVSSQGYCCTNRLHLGKKKKPKQAAKKAQQGSPSTVSTGTDCDVPSPCAS